MNSFVMMVFWMLTVLNSAGQLEPVSKRDLTPDERPHHHNRRDLCLFSQQNEKPGPICLSAI
jgi:hypothetical protein